MTTITPQNSSTSYAQSGVDIDAGNALVEAIKPFAKSTSRKGADAALGGFGALFDLRATGYKDPILVSATDGVGTKLKIAHHTGRHDTIGIDLVAMCVNDLVVQGAEPLFFLDYFATGKLNVAEAKEVVRGIAEGCKRANCALIGGETAEMPGMYKAGDYDLAGFSVGAVERDEILPQASVKPGDVLLGIASSGVHSNGFSLVRHIMEKVNISYNDPAPFAQGKTFADILLEPTIIYVRSCLAAIKTGHVKALAHITGGGLLENIPRVLPENITAIIDCSSWNVPAIFTWLAKEGNVSTTEMLRTFNSGIGMVVVVAEEQAAAITSLLQEQGETVYNIGRLVEKQTDAVVFEKLEGWGTK